ncbi:MAG: hypothetical protein LH479_07520 [Polaromonas sp.]|nr:hypothetical protein [Polaromonas sp.]
MGQTPGEPPGATTALPGGADTAAAKSAAQLVEQAGPVNANPTENQSDAEWQSGVRQGLLIGAAVLALVIPQVTLQPQPAAPAQGAVKGPVAQAGRPLRLADFGETAAAAEVKQLANWIVDSGDNGQRFFVLLDKRNTHVFLFNTLGTLISSTPVLIGAAKGDDSVVGIGARPIADVAPNERTTPAGRFEAGRGRNTLGEDVIWVDYDAAVSMHRVRAIEPAERRLERLASPQTDDNRISYGCVNVPVRFYETVIQPAFAAGAGLVYVMPEVKALGEVFPALYDVRARRAGALASSR